MPMANNIRAPKNLARTGLKKFMITFPKHMAIIKAVEVARAMINCENQGTLIPFMP
jgi:hypothetical protein